MKRNGHILVIGSIAMDFVVVSERRAKKGETIIGESFENFFGGKGANQAIACSRLGVSTKMCGCIGDDRFGKACLKNLEENGIDCTYVNVIDDISTGSAHINISEFDNSIVVIEGANARLNVEHVQKALNSKELPSMVIIQNEIPIEVIEYAIHECYLKNIPCLYNPAPVKQIASKYLLEATYLTPNENEFNLLFSEETKEKVLEKMPNQLVITLGEKGVCFHNSNRILQIPAYVCEVIDTTGAGDCFNGAFAVGCINGLSMEEAIKFANFAAAFSIQKKGAQNGNPTLMDLKRSPNYEEAWNFE